MNVRLVLCCAVAIMLNGCAQSPRRIELSPLLAGEWAVVGRGERGTVLMETHTAARRFAVLRDSAVPVPHETINHTLGNAQLTLLRVSDVFVSATSPPHLVRSPVQPNHYTFEHADAIWLFAAPDTFIKLTNDDDLTTLRGKQREGVVILYWSTDPIWSADGRYISFVSNREAVRAGSNGQSLWVIDVASKRERALLAPARVSLRAQGVLGAEFLFVSDQSPGVLAVDAVTGATRQFSDGFVLASHEGGRGVAVGVGEPESRVVWQHRADTAYALPMPGPGFIWSTQARFSPNGDRLALLATDGAGVYRLFIFDKPGAEPLSIDIPGGPSFGPAWAADDAVVFASARLREPTKTWIARMR